MRALEFQEYSQQNKVTKFTMKYLPTGKKLSLDWLDCWYGFIKDPSKKNSFIHLKQLRDSLGDDNIDFEIKKEKK